MRIRDKLAPLALLLVFVMSGSTVSGSENETEVYDSMSAGRLIDQAEQSYYNAELDQALEILDHLQQRADLSGDEKLKGFLLEAYCHTALREIDAAKRAIKSAWKVRNELKVDPEEAPRSSCGTTTTY